MTSWTGLTGVGFRDRANFDAVFFRCPLESVRDVLVAPVVVDDRVSLPTMRVAVSDACEFTDNDR